MSQQEKTVFIPFRGGMDLYGNPHLLKPGVMTAATGVALNRPGYAYAGPGFTAVDTGENLSKQMNYGLASYTQANKLADRLLAWCAPDNTGAIVSSTYSAPNQPIIAPTNELPSQPSAGTPLYPWRQQVARIYPGEGSKPGLGTATTYNMSGAPQVCGLQGGNIVYAWKNTNNNLMFLVYYAGIGAGLYVLTSGGTLSSSANSPMTVAGKWVLVGNQTSFNVGWLNGSNNLQWTGYRFSTGGSQTGTIIGPFTDIEGVSPPMTSTNDTSGNSAILVRDNVNTSLKVYTFNNVLQGGPFTVLSGLAAGSTAPLACTSFGPADGVNTYYAFATMNASNFPIAAVTNTAMTVQYSQALSAYISSHTPGFTGYSVGSLGTPVQLAVGSTWSTPSTDVGASLGFAIEWKPSAVSVGGVNATYNSVLFVNCPLFQSAGTNSDSAMATGWGGVALMGKPFRWTWQTTTDPVQGAQVRQDWVVPVRSGWRHNDGTWGTATTAGTPMAYPNGYFYNLNGQLIGRFGDADVGSDSLWPEFASASYTPQSLPVLAGPISGSLANGASAVLWCFPQLTSYQTVSVRTADSGAIIGAKPGVSTVTLEAPSLVESVAGSQQMGNTLCVPGLLTGYYDGNRTVEAGFLHRSPTPWVTLLSGGSIPTGVQRYYQTVLMYTDGNGRVHYGAPSRLVLSPATTSGNQQFTIAVPYCKQTLRSGLQPTLILVYASADNPGTVTNSQSIAMYLVAASSLSNNAELLGSNPATSDYYGSFTDATLTGTLTTLPTIYTYGLSILAGTGNDAPPPFDSLTLWNNRLWGVANRNGPELWFTWPLDASVLQPEAPAWSRQNRIPLPADIGQPRAIVGLDDKLLVLGTRADYGITGDGPARTTTQIETGGFTTPIQLPTPGGIQVLNGVTRLPQGILFQAAQGFTLLDRSLTYKALGNPVNAYTDVAGNLYGPGVFNTANQCVMLFSVLGSQYDLMYFYSQDEWSQCEHPGVNSSTDASVIVGSTRLVNGTAGVYVIPATGMNYYRVTQYSTYMSFRTPWIELGESGTQYSPGASLAGSGMLREVQLIGDPAGGGFTTTLFTEYDYFNNTAQPTETQTLTSVTSDAQWRFGFANGNCRRVRLTVTINAGTRGTASQPPVYLAGLMLTYAVDQGLSRLGSGNST